VISLSVIHYNAYHISANTSEVIDNISSFGRSGVTRNTFYSGWHLCLSKFFSKCCFCSICPGPNLSILRPRILCWIFICKCPLLCRLRVVVHNVLFVFHPFIEPLLPLRTSLLLIQKCYFLLELCSYFFFSPGVSRPPGIRQRNFIRLCFFSFYVYNLDGWRVPWGPSTGPGPPPGRILGQWVGIYTYIPPTRSG